LTVTIRLQLVYKRYEFKVSKQKPDHLFETNKNCFEADHVKLKV